jgi:hypothetical protein
MQTLIPQSASATAKPLGKTGRVLGYGLTRLGWLLFVAGLLMAIPAFFHAGRIGFMWGWDVLLAALVLIDVLWLPRPELFTVTRTFLDSPQLGQPTRVELSVRQEGDSVLNVRMIDDLHPALVAAPALQRVEAFPREAVVSTIRASVGILRWVKSFCAIAVRSSWWSGGPLLSRCGQREKQVLRLRLRITK